MLLETGTERAEVHSCFQKLETRLGARAEYCREQLSGKFRFDFAIVPALSTLDARQMGAGSTRRGTGIM